MDCIQAIFIYFLFSKIFHASSRRVCILEKKIYIPHLGEELLLQRLELEMEVFEERERKKNNLIRNEFKNEKVEFILF